MAKIELDEEVLSDVVRQHLIQSLEVVEFLAQPEDIQFRQSLLDVIKYYCNPTQWEEFCEKKCHYNWLEMMNETT